MRTFELKGKTFESDLSFEMAQEVMRGRISTGDLVRGEFVDKLASAERLSPKQEPWLHWFANGFDKKDAVTADLRRVFKMLDEARRCGIKHPAIRVQLGDSVVKLTLAGERSRFPGAINAVRTEDRSWMGRVLRSGEVHIRDESLLDKLKLLASDPVNTCRLYGRRLNHCCFCGRELENHVSVELGYGPVCAKHYGLPHDEAAYEESKFATIDEDIERVLAERKKV